MEYLDFLGDSSLQQIETIPFKFNDYRIELLDSPWKHIPNINIDKEWYIIGENLLNNNEKQDYKNPQILLSLLELGKTIIETNGQGDQISEESQLLLSDKIIKWCKRYGLPYNEEFLQKNYKKPLFGFRIGDFKRQLAVLYNSFNVYYGVTFNEIDLVKKYPPSSLVDIDTESGMQYIKESFANELWGSANISLKTEYNKETKKFEMIPYTNNYIEIAYFQISMLLIGDQEEKIKYCTKCGSLFIFNHGNETHCSKCKPNINAEKQRRHQAKIKKSVIEEYANGNSISELSIKYKKTESQIKKWIDKNRKD